MGIHNIFVQGAYGKQTSVQDPGQSKSEPGIIRDDLDASGKVSNLST